MENKDKKGMMNKREKALEKHNKIFTKKAIELRILEEPYRFVVIYDDGSKKYDYECGSEREEISKCLK
jgi:hypothetical protein